MKPTQVDFEQIAWEKPPGVEGARGKAQVVGDKRLRLLKFAPGFVEDEWCARGHVGYVIGGRFQTEFADETIVWQAGQALLIPPDPPHQARNDGQVPALTSPVDGGAQT